MPEPEISIVIPIFDEAESLPRLADEITAALPREPTYEVLLMDDGSTDESLEVMRSLGAGDRRLRVFHWTENRGQSAALAAGFRHARGRIIVTLDADLQYDAADIPKVIDALAEADVVSGVRARRRDSAVRRFSSLVANGVRRRILHDGVSDVGCSLKAYRADIARDLLPFDGSHRFLPALAQMQGARVREIPVRHRPRQFGSSSYGIHDRLWRGLVDLLGVRWLQRRWLNLDPMREVKVDCGRAVADGDDLAG